MKLDSFSFPEKAWCSRGDKRLLEATACSIGKIAYFGNFEVSYIQSKLQPDWREEREKEINDANRSI